MATGGQGHVWPSESSAAQNSATLVFDFGGVVQAPLDPVLIRTLAGRLSAPIGVVSSYWYAHVGDVQAGRLSEAEFVQGLWKQVGSEIEGIMVDEIFTKPFQTDARLYPEVVSLLDELHDAGRSLALLSNTVPSQARLNRRQDNFRWFGENVFLSCELGVRKPFPESFDIVEGRTGKRPDLLVLIDDNPKNVEAARHAGMRAILHDSSTDSIRRLRSYLCAASLHGKRPA